MLDLYEEFKSIIAALNEREIDYAVCGGLAMAVYGEVRFADAVNSPCSRQDTGICDNFIAFA